MQQKKKCLLFSQSCVLSCVSLCREKRDLIIIIRVPKLFFFVSVPAHLQKKCGRAGKKIMKKKKLCRVFSRGSGGGRRPPPDFGGKRVPPRGGTHFDLGKKGYGGWLGVTRTYPHLGHHVRNPHQKKKGRQGVERARSASYPLPGIIVKRI